MVAREEKSTVRQKKGSKVGEKVLLPRGNYNKQTAELRRSTEGHGDFAGTLCLQNPHIS
jgi:hypothetical protein